VAKPLDLGVFDQGASVPFELELVNPTSSFWTIQIVDPGCGCTAIKGVGETLSPNGTAKISGVVSTTGLQGDVNINVKVLLSSSGSDAESSATTLRHPVKLNVTTPFDLSPSKLEFSDGESARAQVSVTPRRSGDWVIRLIDVSHPSLIVRDRNMERPLPASFTVEFDPKLWRRTHGSLRPIRLEIMSRSASKRYDVMLPVGLAVGAKPQEGVVP
jgi:hypothetical protein